MFDIPKSLGGALQRPARQPVTGCRPTHPGKGQREMGKAKKVAIVTDSSIDLPPRLAEELEIIMAPLRLIIEGKEYRDKINITTTGFYERLPQLNPLPTTTGTGRGRPVPHPGQRTERHLRLGLQRP